MEKDNFTKIDLYLADQLPASEKSAFELAMNQNAALKKEVQIHRLERRATRTLLKNNFREKIKKNRAASTISWDSITDESSAAAPKEVKVFKMRPLKRILSMAAAGLVFILAGSIWWSNTQFSNERLAEEGYYQAASAGNKSRGNEADPIFQGGLQAYFVNKDYVQAIQQFSAIPITDGNYLAAQYYLGHSQLQAEQFSAAIAAFEKVLQAPIIPPFMTKEEVTWNQLMAYMGIGDTGTVFQQKLNNLITSGQPPFQQKAKNLQAQLGSFWRNFVF